ncbi:aminotransferase class I/II-fold pyridoxal phosphate-dependent enzyme [uncultured Desulfobacter sp.]|uniref:pyridoxal phosphate-dependent aminotransferase n=1 Tax=uncultured Desulfobacter sp. TaxID=240139 RepID=UPI002AAA89DF|nr:aminotransferase class I/II-fold pyridoxal phosphate-dependent enzyme [uncultured Desulfobacter sp.]
MDKNELNVPFPEGMTDEVTKLIDEYLFQAYPSTWNTIEKACILLEHKNNKEVLLVPGSDYALKLCYEALLNPGTGNVGLPDPTYAMNEVYAKIAGASITHFPYEKDLRLNQEAVFKSLSALKMIVLANPNQPTGMLEKDSFILQLLEESHKNNVWVIIDEAYYSFSNYTAAAYVQEFDNLIITRSFSKSYGVAGLRIGAIISCPKNIDYLSKALPVYCVNSIALRLLDVLVKYKPGFDKIHDEFVLQRAEIINYFNGIGCKCFNSDTNFVMVESNSVFDVGDYIRYLNGSDILIRGPWTKLPYMKAFRISVSSKENIGKLKIVTNRFLNM